MVMGRSTLGGYNWLRIAGQHNSFYNVLDFGAARDGITDDAAAIRAAITECYNQGCGIVYLPAGTYNVASTLNVPPRVGICGAGWLTTIVNFSGTLTNGFLLSGGPYAGGLGQGSYFRDLTVQQAAGAAISNLITVEDWFQFAMRETRLNSSSGYCLNLANNLITCHFNNCGFTGAKDAGAYINGSTTVAFYSCIFNNTTHGPGVKVYNSANVNFFNNCVFEANGLTVPALGYGAYVDASQAVFSGCYWENNGSHDGYFGATATSCVSVVGPYVIAGPIKLATSGGFLFNNTSGGCLVGGSLANAALACKTLLLTTNTIGLAVAGTDFYTTPPEMLDGSPVTAANNALVQWQDYTEGGRIKSLLGPIHAKSYGGALSKVFYGDGYAELTGDMEVLTIGRGVIIASPNGTRYRIIVDNTGVLSTSVVT